MPKQRVGTKACLVLVPALAITALTAQGPPPHAGGDAPTEISECQVIYQPGPHIVVNNLPGPGGLLSGGEGGFAVAGDCLAINTSNVSIDGQGYRMVGTGGRTEGYGIRLEPLGHLNIHIHNLHVVNFKRGVDLTNAFSSVVENVKAVSNTQSGVAVTAGQSNRVLNNICLNNGGSGLSVSPRSIVANNIASGNTTGVAVICPALVEGNVATANGLDFSLSGGDCVSVNNVPPIP